MRHGTIGGVSGTGAAELIEPTRPRLLAALAVTAMMWVAAMFAVGVALVTPMMYDDVMRRNEPKVAFAAASATALVLFVGSGPVAYWIGRRRWLMALPLAGLCIWGLGAAVAYRT